MGVAVVDSGRKGAQKPDYESFIRLYPVLLFDFRDLSMKVGEILDPAGASHQQALGTRIARVGRPDRKAERQREKSPAHGSQWRWPISPLREEVRGAEAQGDRPQPTF